MLGWSLVEWAQRVGECLPTDRLEISIVPADATQRLFTISAGGSVAAATLRALSERIDMTGPSCHAD